MRIWEGKSDKLLHEIQDQFSGAWQPKSVGTLVDRVQNNEDWAVIGKCERRQRAVLGCIVATKSGGSPYFLLCLRFKAVGTTSLHRDKAFECVGGQRAAELRLEVVRMRCRLGGCPSRLRFREAQSIAFKFAGFPSLRVAQNPV